ncbi:hypothetical protein Leryth_009899 [Lithospermum erythrorhizon]|nr:hypothetical protein Leryth_009899 [Lithospermum erythrorhizon]
MISNLLKWKVDLCRLCILLKLAPQDWLDLWQAENKLVWAYKLFRVGFCSDCAFSSSMPALLILNS